MWELIWALWWGSFWSIFVTSLGVLLWAVWGGFSGASLGHLWLLWGHPLWLLFGFSRARQGRSVAEVLLAREQFIKNVWNCTRNGFGARKPPAERSPRPNVLVLSSGMPQGAETTVFVVPENAMALKLRVSSSENRAWELTGDGSTIFVERNVRKRKKHSICVALVNRVAARFRSTKQVLLAFL